MLDRYESKYKICDHAAVADARPLSLIGMHPAEEVGLGSILYDSLERFGEENVTKYFGCSINEFLDMPHDICEKLIEISTKLKLRDNTNVNSVLSQLEQNEK